MSDRQRSRGILYIAMGGEYIEEARKSAEQAHSVMDISISLICDQHFQSETFDHVITIDGPAYHFGDQVNHITKSPYDRTIYLDTDIFVYEDISELFDLLAHFDIGAAFDSHRTITEDHEMDGVPASFPEYNTGVVVFEENPRVKDVFRRWQEIYKEADYGVYPKNQPAFRKALFEGQARIATLPPEYNCLYTSPGDAVGTVKVFHGRLLEGMEGADGARPYVHDLSRIIEKLNSTTQHRVYTQVGGFRVWTNRRDSLNWEIRSSIANRGVRYTFREAVWRLVKVIRRFMQKLYPFGP